MKYSNLCLAILSLGLSIVTPAWADSSNDSQQTTAVVATTTTATQATLPQGYGVPTSQPRLQDDFYSHVNYNYLTTHKLPEDKAEINNFSDLSDKNRDIIKTLFKDLNNNYANLTAGSDEQKVIDFYNMAVDFKTRDQLGLTPVQPHLSKVQAVKNLAQFFQVEQDFFLADYGMLMSAGVAQDQKNSDINVLYIAPPATGLDKFYLEGKDKFAKSIQQAYKNHMVAIFKHIGYPTNQAQRKAKLVFDFEKQLASAKLTREQEQDLQQQYNPMTLNQLQKLAPHVPYTALLQSFGLDKANKIIVSQPKALQKLNQVVTAKNLEAMKSQLEYQIVTKNSYNLSKDIYKSLVDYGQAFTGLNYIEPDEDLAYQLTDGRLGELVGKIYVAHNFSPATKADVVTMTQQIRDTYKERIKTLDWLSQATKEKAIAKLDALTIKIGYPDKWDDYSQLVIKPYSQGGNLVAVRDQLNTIEAHKNLAELNQAPDRSKWGMYPQQINAYYNPINNEIVFPAAILQEPFYSPTNTRAQNLGGIGAVIAHEMSHALDSTGAMFDAKGNINNWWTPEDFRRFEAKVKQAASIYNKLEVADGYKVNGDISTGEILADLGGLTVALDIAAKEGIDQKQVMESYARVWRNIATKEAQISAITDEHPPGKYRVNYIVNQMDSFYKEYNVQPSDKLYMAPEQRLRVW